MVHAVCSIVSTMVHTHIHTSGGIHIDLIVNVLNEHSSSDESTRGEQKNFFSPFDSSSPSCGPDGVFIEYDYIFTMKDPVYMEFPLSCLKKPTSVQRSAVRFDQLIRNSRRSVHRQSI